MIESVMVWSLKLKYGCQNMIVEDLIDHVYACCELMITYNIYMFMCMNGWY